jgi:alpha-1,3-mannosyltransferase
MSRQFLIAFPFLPVNAMGYLSRAFELSRQFLFKWTVNWRFIGEDLFLSKEFSIFLLSAHVSLLAVFGITRWLKPSGSSLFQVASWIKSPPPAEVERAIASRITPKFIMTTILTAIAIGMLCARSLHYQFFALISWATPFLLWRSGMHPVLQVGFWAAQEWAWNVYPSTLMPFKNNCAQKLTRWSKGTDVSSKVVVATLVIQVFGVWWGTRNDFSDSLKTGADDESHPHKE